MLQGNLQAIGIADILQLLAAQEKSGYLTLSNSSDNVRLTLHGGRVADAESKVQPIEERLRRLLTVSGAVGSEQMLAALATRRQTGQHLGRILTEQQACDADLVRRILTVQIADLVYEVLRWSDGDYTFRPSETVEHDADSFQPMGVQEVLMEGMYRIDEWPRLDGPISDPASVFLPIGFPEDDLPEPEATVFEALDGELTVQGLIDRTLLGEFTTRKALFDLSDRGLVEPVAHSVDNLTVPNQSASGTLRRPDGTFHSMTFGRLLRDTYARTWSGRLLAGDGDERRAIRFCDGRVVGASGRNPDARLGAILVRLGLVERDVVEVLVESGRGSIGRELLRRNLLSHEDLARGLEEQILTVVVPMFGWEDTLYYLEERATEESGLPVAGLSTAEIILAGVRRVHDSSALGTLRESNVCLAPHSDPRLRYQKARLRSEEGFMLSCFDGRTTLEDVIRLSPLDEELTCGVIFGLLQAGLVEPGTVSDTSTDPLLAPEVAAEVAAESRPTERELMQLVSQFAELDHYGVLDVGPDATLQQINSAYRRLSKRYHPDHGSTVGERRIMEILFARVIEAGQVLRDQKSRAEFDRCQALGFA